MGIFRVVRLPDVEYARNANLYLVTDGGFKGLGTNYGKLDDWFNDPQNAMPHMFRNGSLNDLAGAVQGAKALAIARNLGGIMLVFAPITVGDYHSRYKQYNPAVDAVVVRFQRLTLAAQKTGVIWTHSFAGPSTTIALAEVAKPDVKYLRHHSVAPAFYHANLYKGALGRTHVRTTIYQAGGDLVSRNGSFTHNPFALARGSVHDDFILQKKNLTFVPFKGGDHPLADYISCAEFPKGPIASDHAT